MKLPELKDLLAYEHPKTLQAFRLDYPTLAPRAEELFQSTLKFLWLSRKLEADRAVRGKDPALDFPLVMHEEMRDIDTMWHAFILNTRAYRDFCTKYFGVYMDHEPNMASALSESPETFQNNFRLYLSYIYDHLGEETVRQWFETSPKALADSIQTNPSSTES